MIKAVLFDMDGVLFDSMPNHAQSWHEVMTRHGITCAPQDFFYYEGMVGSFTINKLFEKQFGRSATAEEIKKIYGEKTAAFTTLPPAQVMPGAAETLELVASMGLQRVLVTGSGQKSLINKLNQAFPGVFTPSNMVTAFDVTHGKPHPEPYLKGLMKAGVSFTEAIVVENAPAGVEAARAADIYTIAVNTGPLPDEVLLNSGANLLLPSMNALFETFPHWYHSNGK